MSSVKLDPKLKKRILLACESEESYRENYASVKAAVTSNEKCAKQFDRGRVRTAEVSDQVEHGESDRQVLRVIRWLTR